ncbi:MAG: ABC transporter permease [Blastocatellia bacterium]|nr:ABC transporter permease [Blastocatellia bacterium]
MTTMNLLHAELLKARKQQINIFLVLIITFVAVFFHGWLVIAAKVNPSYIKDAEVFLPYYNSLNLSVKVISFFSSIIAIVFVANSVGGEYSQDTWKMILPRYGSRIKFITTKLIVGLLAMILLYLLGVTSWLALSAFSYWLLDLNPPPQVLLTLKNGLPVSNSLKTLVLEMFSMSFYGSLTLLATIGARSFPGGILGGSVSSLLMTTATIIPSKYVSLSLPSLHIANLSAQWMQNKKEIEAVAMAFRGNVSMSVSLVIVLAYITCFIITALLLFQKRDMAGH